MGGIDKGFMLLNGKPLIEHVYTKLSQQIKTISINANRNIEKYKKLAPVHSDSLCGFLGPLAGIHASLATSTTQWVGFTPCDTPNLPDDLVKRLSQNLDDQIDIYVAHDGEHSQPVFSVWNQAVITKLDHFLHNGDRKMKLLFEQCNVHYVDFSDIPDTFVNLNTPEELAQFNQ